VSVSDDVVTVLGTGFSPLSVINLFNRQGTMVVNLGGFNESREPNIPLTLIASTELRFTRPAAAQAGLAFVQVLNPPFIPFSSTFGPGEFTLP
jgi:hypothetical protein